MLSIDTVTFTNHSSQLAFIWAISRVLHSKQDPRKLLWRPWDSPTLSLVTPVIIIIAPLLCPPHFPYLSYLLYPSLKKKKENKKQ